MNSENKTKWFKCFITDKTGKEFFVEICTESSVKGVEKALNNKLKSNFKFIDCDTAKLIIKPN